MGEREGENGNDIGGESGVLEFVVPVELLSKGWVGWVVEEVGKKGEVEDLSN